MRAKKLLFSVLLFCGMAVFATVLAHPDSSANTVEADLLKQKTVAIGMTGLEYGSVDIRIVDNGKSYMFTGSRPGFIGEFIREGTTLDVELFFHGVSPEFSRLTTTPNFLVTKISSTQYHITVCEDEMMPHGEIGLHFGNF
jgi:hypothetical protein